VLHRLFEIATHLCHTTLELYEVLGGLRPSVSRAKRIEDAYETSCLSVVSPGLNLSGSKMATILRTIGKRSNIRIYEKEFG